MGGNVGPRRGVGNLPVSTTSFVGRRRERVEVRQRLSSARLVTLIGAGGVGKTRLAIEAGRQAAGAFPDGVWLVDLASLTQGPHIAQTVVSTVGAVDLSTAKPFDKLVDHLAQRQLLLVLDNCEHLLAECSPFVDALLRAVPGVSVLATSRQTLDVPGEHLVTVAPLPVPEPTSDAGSAALLHYDSINLLVERARAVHQGFALTEDNYECAARLCAQLDGIPLAIELAATRLRSLSLEELVERLEDPFAVLTAGSRTAAPRQQTLRRLIDWSYGLCSENEQRLWARLSVFSGRFDLAAAEGVCAADDLPARQVLELLDRLVARSIVVCEHGDAGAHGGHGARFRLLETIRQYGRQRLEEAGELGALQLRHRDHNLALAQRIARAWCGPGQEAGLARLRADHPNLRAALMLSMGAGGAGPALELVTALRHHWYADGFLGEGRDWLDRALALPDQPAQARCTALWVAAWVSLLQGDRATAMDRLAETDCLAADLGDTVAAAFATSLRGTAALFNGELDAAAERFESAAVALEAAGDHDGALVALFQHAITLAHAGDWVRAAAICERALALSTALGERWVRSYVLWAWAYASWLGGDARQAATLAREALTIQQGFSDHVGAGLMIELLAWVAASQAEYSRAARLLGAAQSVWTSIGTTIAAFGPQHTGHHDRCAAAAAAGLRENQFRSATAKVTGLTVAQAIAVALDDDSRAVPAQAKATTPELEQLTRRELQVAQLVARGLTNKAIAKNLVLSPRTVDGHVERILTKLAFTSRAQVAAWVTEHAPPAH